MESLTEFIIDHFWAIVAGILGPAFVGFIAYRNNSINRSAEAAKKFRSVINIEILKGIRGRELEAAMLGAVAGTGERFEGEFAKHKRAVQEFRTYLGPISRIRFNNAWKKYHGGNEECPDLFKRYCLPENGNELLVKHLEKLRKFGEIN